MINYILYLNLLIDLLPLVMIINAESSFLLLVV